MLKNLDAKRVINLIGASFSHGWLYFGCVYVALGFWSTLVFTAFSGCLGVLAMLCLLVARRRRALVLQGLKRGFIIQQQGQQQQQQSSDEAAKSINALARAKNKQWPDGAARMFEGSDIFFESISMDELWDFYFSSPRKDGKDDPSLVIFHTSLSISDPLRFVTEHLWTLLGDVTELTGGITDTYHCFTAASCLALVVVGMPNLTALAAASSGSNNNKIGGDDDEHHTMLHKYYPTALHGVVGITAVICILLATSPRALGLDVTWLKVRIFAAVVLLCTFCGLRDGLLFGSWNDVLRHFPSNTQIFANFYGEPQTESQRFVDHLESEHLNMFRLAKRPMANPTACLKPQLQSKNTSSSSSSSNNNNDKKQSTTKEEALDEEDEHVIIGDYVPLSRQWLIASICMLFSFYGEISGLKREPLQIAGESSSSPAFAPSVLMKDSVSFFHSQYMVLIAVRVVGAFFFGWICTLVSPMMSWEMSYGSWLGVTYLKAKSGGGSSLGLIDGLLVLVLLVASILVTSQSVLRIITRITSNTKSFYMRYPWLKHVVLLLVASLLAANEATFTMSAAAVRGKGERIHRVDDPSSHEAGPSVFRLRNLFSLGGMAQMVHAASLHNLFGFNPWSVLTKVHWILGAVKCFLPPLMLYSRSEQALQRLGLPNSMISVNGEAMLLDRGRALMLGLALSGGWTLYVLSL